MTTRSLSVPRGCAFVDSPATGAFALEDFAADEQLMIQTAEQFSRKEIMPLQDRLDAQEEGLMPSIVRKAGELGLCGIDTPEQYGGLGLGKNLAARMLEFLSLNASVSVTIGVSTGISQVGLKLFGTEAQREKFLPPLASGEQIGAYCLSEPNAGTDAFSLSTRADQKGDKWVLNGTKMWISNAKWAHQFLVVAKVGGEKVTTFLVTRDTPGVTIEREEHKLGLKGSSTARVILENAEIPLDQMIHEEGRGHVVAMNSLNIGRFKLAAMSIGPAREAMGQSARYAQDRKQFGQPIGRFGLIQQKFAEMAARFYAAESMIYRVGADMDAATDYYLAQAEMPKVQQNIAWAEAYSVECSMVKVYSTEAEAFIVDESLQVYGGYGFTEEFPLARIYRDCRISRIYEGSNEINRFFIADRLLRRVRDGQLDLNAAPQSFTHELFLRGLKAVAGMEQVHQSIHGALADLAILHYADQSAMARVSRWETAFGPLATLHRNWANGQSARAFQAITGEPVQIPAPQKVELGAIAELVFGANGPVSAL